MLEPQRFRVYFRHSKLSESEGKAAADRLCLLALIHVDLSARADRVCPGRPAGQHQVLERDCGPIVELHFMVCDMRHTGMQHPAQLGNVLHSHAASIVDQLAFPAGLLRKQSSVAHHVDYALSAVPILVES